MSRALAIAFFAYILLLAGWRGFHLLFSMWSGVVFKVADILACLAWMWFMFFIVAKISLRWQR